MNGWKSTDCSLEMVILVSPDGFWGINANKIVGGGAGPESKLPCCCRIIICTSKASVVWKGIHQLYPPCMRTSSYSLISQCKLYLIPSFFTKMTATKLYRLNNLSWLSLIVYVLYVYLILRRGRQYKVILFNFQSWKVYYFITDATIYFVWRFVLELKRLNKK